MRSKQIEPMSIRPMKNLDRFGLRLQSLNVREYHTCKGLFEFSLYSKKKIIRLQIVLPGQRKLKARVRGLPLRGAQSQDEKGPSEGGHKVKYL
jgi:hypothetical protein